MRMQTLAVTSSCPVPSQVLLSRREPLEYARLYGPSTAIKIESVGILGALTFALDLVNRAKCGLVCLCHVSLYFVTKYGIPHSVV